MEHLKVKSAAKLSFPKGPGLKKAVLEAMKHCSDMVGGTLGPGGHTVLIERPEYGLPPFPTKDGVTVFRALGFDDPVAHCIMEAARDASVRTANEAGDGTTTATILAEAVVRRVFEYCEANPSVSPQQVVREIQHLHKTVLAPELERLAVPAALDTDEGHRLLRAVALVSANGDEALADSVMRCYDICGDDGNVTIVEASGPHGYEEERVDGFPIPMGYEESCGRFGPAFVNRPETQQVLVERPVFVLYFGRLNDVQTIMPLMQKLQEAMEGEYLNTPNVVVVATGFSEQVQAAFAQNWAAPASLNIFPLAVPPSPQHNGQRNFLDDLAAYVGAAVFDPVTKPLDTADAFHELGNIALDDEDNRWKTLGVRSFEVSRYRSTVLGYCQEDILLARADVVRAQAEQAGSELDAILTRERLAKLTGGIARLKVIGSSNGELKERRDRAEDAICAVRGAIKHGCLPAGGWALASLVHKLQDAGTDVTERILIPALLEPVERLVRNIGMTDDGVQTHRATLLGYAAAGTPRVFDAQGLLWVNAHEAGLMDSVPAVRDALKNALSIATVLGTLGGVVVFPRDRTHERSEAKAAAEFDRFASNPADERAY